MSQNIIILGPTSTGKTDLANFIATNLELPVFNCDSVQIYKDLNLLTNKPAFIETDILEEERISFTKSTQFLDFNKYDDFKFKIFSKNASNLNIRECENGKELQQYLINKNILKNKISNIGKVSNYLFNIRNPLESYSAIEFLEDIDRISSKFDIDSKIIVGGTIYYAYNYLFNSNSKNSSNQEASILVDFKEKLKDQSMDELIIFLEANDPELLKTIDTSNKSRLINAVAYIQAYGEKYSKVYFKDENILEGFVLIMIYPKNREEYCARLDKIVEKRINLNSIKEVEDLLDRYNGEVIESWLGKISYEYKYAIEIYNLMRNKGFSNIDLKEYGKILEVLKAKERQYTKGQLTFMRKIERKLLINND